MASLLAVALVARLAVEMSRSDVTVTGFLGSFTVLSNIVAVMTLSMSAARPALGDSSRFAHFRGAATVYMGVTGLLHASMLASGIDPGGTEPWIDWTLRVIGPLAVMVDWLAHPPAARLRQAAASIWVLPAAVYLGYALVRGAVVDSYPYPFLDPGTSDGYGRVATWSAGGLIATLALSFALTWWATRPPAPSSPA